MAPGRSRSSSGSGRGRRTVAKKTSSAGGKSSGGGSSKPTSSSGRGRSSKFATAEKDPANAPVTDATSIDQGGMPMVEATKPRGIFGSAMNGTGGGGGVVVTGGTKHSFAEVVDDDNAAAATGGGAPGGGSGGHGSSKRTKRIVNDSNGTAMPVAGSGDPTNFLTDLTSNVTAGAAAGAKVAVRTGGRDGAGAGKAADGFDGAPPATIDVSGGQYGGSAGDAFADGDAFAGMDGTPPDAVIPEGKNGEDPPAATSGNSNGSSGEEEDSVEDPDWDAVMKHEPAKTDVPLFLAARSKFDNAKARFHDSLDEYNGSLESCKKALIEVPVKIYTDETDKVQSMEDNLKQGFVRNTEKRDTIEENLRKSAEAAQGLFANLLMKMGGVGAGPR